MTSKAEYYKPYVAVYLIFRNARGEFLFIRRHNTGWRDGEYTLPAGHVDAGETAIEACIHEAREEVGLEITAKNLRLVHMMQRQPVDSTDNKNFIDFYFECTNWHGEAINNEPEKCDDLKWVAPQDFDQIPIINTVCSALENVERGENISFYGY